jgi:hypothetical protein
MSGCESDVYTPPLSMEWTWMDVHIPVSPESLKGRKRGLIGIVGVAKIIVLFAPRARSGGQSRDSRDGFLPPQE